MESEEILIKIYKLKNNKICAYSAEVIQIVWIRIRRSKQKEKEKEDLANIGRVYPTVFTSGLSQTRNDVNITCVFSMLVVLYMIFHRKTLLKTIFPKAIFRIVW